MKNVPLGVAAAYLGIPAELLALGMRSRMLPVGLAVRSGGLAERRWRYRVIPRRLVACRRRMCGAPPPMVTSPGFSLSSRSTARLRSARICSWYSAACSEPIRAASPKAQM